MAPTRRPSALPTLVIEAAPAYEFLMSLSAATQVDHADTYEIGAEWLDAVKERAGRELLDAMQAVSTGNGDLWVDLAALAYATPEPRDVAGLIDHVRETEAEEIVLRLVGYYARDTQRTTAPDVIRRAVGGDEQAVREFLRTSYPEWEPWQTYLRSLLSGDPSSLKHRMLRVLEGWAERVWPSEERVIMPILQRDAEAKRQLARELPFERFIETATNGVEWAARPGTRTVVMAPSYVNRPWVSHVEMADVLMLVYPVSDESVAAGSDAPPLRLVRLSRALGDEKRLRILRALSEGERTLMELADLFGVPKTTMHHHMVTLRSAGLVSVAAGTKRYRLRHETLPDVAQLLSGYLGAAAAVAGPSAAPRAASTDGAPSRRRRTRVRAAT